MSEIICFYSHANNDKEPGCFILDSNVELSDLKDFLVRSNIMEATQILLDSENKSIESDETFTKMKNDAVSNNATLLFIIAPPVEEKKVEEPFGPLIKQILTTLNINYDNITQLSDIIDNIPFPFSVMARGYLLNIRANPNAIEQIIQSVAPGYSAQAAPLIAEVTHAFAFFDRKERENEEELARKQKEEEIARLEKEAELDRLEREQSEREEQRKHEEQQKREAEQAKQVIGSTMKQILDKVGVEIEITTDVIPILVRYIPRCYRSLILHVMKQLAANVRYVNYAIRYIAQLLDVSETALVSEVHHAFHCFRQAVSSLEDEENQEQAKQKYHHAICDKCQSFITGIRYKCLHCPDYDLCSKCEDINSEHQFHDETHVFAKINTPAHNLPFRGRGISECRSNMIARHNRIANLEATVEELKRAVAVLTENKI